MPNKVTYEYATIRLVPLVEREEFINIGVILFSKRKKYLNMRYHLDQKKIAAISSEIETDMIKQYLSAWEAICRGGPEAGRIGELEMAFRFRWLVAKRDTIIQSSMTHPGLCDDPEKVLEQLFKRNVL